MRQLGLAALLGISVMTNVYAADTPNNITLKAGQQTVQVTLLANATTGYQWFTKYYDHDLLHLQKYQYDPHPTGGKVGVGGTATFTFAVDANFYKAPQTTDLVFVYKQPWSPGMEGAKIAEVMISSVPGSN